MLKTILIASLILSFKAGDCRADIFGGDVAVLTQILANNIQQLSQLIEVVNTGKRQVDLMEDIRREILETIDRIQSMGSQLDPKLYRDWRSISEALDKLQTEYGIVSKSPSSQVQKDMDQSVAKAITFDNELLDYSTRIDEIGEEIKQASELVSPGGAQKLTAHSQGIMLHVINQTLRAHAATLKLQAQSLALQNRERKLLSKQQVASNDEMERELKTKKKLFTLPRF